MIEYTLSWYRLDGRDGYLIWTTDWTNDDEPDRIIMDEAGDLLAFTEAGHAAAYAAGRGWALDQDEPVLHDLDAVRAWIAKPRLETLSCPDFLNAWNLFTDASMSVWGQDFAPRNPITDLVYDKLFDACNLPGMTPEGQHYEPMWGPEEIAGLKRTLEMGLKMFEGYIAGE